MSTLRGRIDRITGYRNPDEEIDAILSLIAEDRRALVEALRSIKMNRCYNGCSITARAALDYEKQQAWYRDRDAALAAGGEK